MVHYQIGVSSMELKSGDILISHPKFYFKDFKKSVIILTEVGPVTTGLMLNQPFKKGMKELLDKQGYDWPHNNEVYIGGFANQSVLYCLHDNLWFSKSTQVVDSAYALSSDDFMIDKIASFNAPEFYKMFFGCLAWGPGQLQKQIYDNHWLVLQGDNKHIVEASTDESLYSLSIENYSQKTVTSFF